MTATITPHAAMPGSINNDSDARRNEYLEALSFYLSQPDSLERIVLLENSGSSLEPFRRLHAESGSSKELILISTSPDYDHSRGKGYGEFLMLDTGLTQLRAEGVLTDESRLWKVTGRHRIANMAELLATSPERYDLYCDLRKVPLIGERLGGNRWMDLRIVSFSLAGYRRFFEGRYGESYVPEKAFFETAYAAWKKNPAGIHPRFRVQPQIRGTSGLTGASYSSPAYRTKEGLRRIGRRLLPGLWL